MALTFEDVRDKVFVGLGAIIVAGLVFLVSSTIHIKADVLYLKSKMEGMPNREEIARIAAQETPYAYDKERLGDRITGILIAQNEMKAAIEKLAQYQREVQMKSLEDQRVMQIQIQTLTTQFSMWRDLERKRIQQEGGYDPEKKTYNVDESTPYRPNPNNPTKATE